MLKQSNSSVIFWGVRGSFATPIHSNIEVGGNTACVEIQTGTGKEFIIDAGTGLRNLGRSLQRSRRLQPLKVNILLSHFHWDHICGLLAFDPLYSPDTEITFVSGYSAEQAQSCIRSVFRPPYFPINWDDTPAQKRFIDASDKILHLGGVEVKAFPINHCYRSYGYRLDTGTSKVVYASDMEHGNPQFEPILFENSYAADLLVIDAHYTPEEYDSHRGWGHGTWLEAAKFSVRCAIRNLVLFHHHPDHSDSFLEKILSESKKIFPRTYLAREGMKITI